MNQLERELADVVGELQRVQQELREAAARWNELRQERRPDKKAIAELEALMATLRRRRGELQDRHLALRRQMAGKEAVDFRPVSPSHPATRRKPRALGRAVLALVMVAAVVAGVGLGALWGVTRLLAPPPLRGVASETEAETVLDEDPKSLEQRLIGLYLAFRRDDLMRPAGDDDTPVIFVVEPGETAVTIAHRLEAEGLITDANLFRRLLVYRGADQKLAAGTYQLRRTMTMDEIILALQAGRPEEIVITIPEGWRAEEIATHLEAQGLFSADAYLALVRDPARFREEFPFLQDVPAGTTLEGFLFPDTYRVVKGEADPEAFIRMQLATFDRRVTKELREGMAAKGMTLYEGIILASLVEREAVVDDERPLIAGVFENRWRDGMLLNADPTVQYALGYQEDQGTWWKRPLTLEDLEVDSPYNTYKYPGLPPGPICNPGLAAIRAVALAPPTDFYYFVARGDGTHVFARTLEEHLQNVERYRR
ncbi:MAG: endolytic transglycosylase MltG [Ardenticatenia bacterium]|nr:endolytic transglycosylase MltG [Ardenticatenia bacterium]